MWREVPVVSMAALSNGSPTLCQCITSQLLYVVHWGQCPTSIPCTLGPISWLLSYPLPMLVQSWPFVATETVACIFWLPDCHLAMSTFFLSSPLQGTSLKLCFSLSDLQLSQQVSSLQGWTDILALYTPSQWAAFEHGPSFHAVMPLPHYTGINKSLAIICGNNNGHAPGSHNDTSSLPSHSTCHPKSIHMSSAVPRPPWG
jgi:hypothetical protein